VLFEAVGLEQILTDALIHIESAAGFSSLHHFDWHAETIERSALAQFHTITPGCLRTSVLLLCIGALAPGRTLEKLKQKHWSFAISAALAAFAIIARLTYHQQLDRSDLFAAVILVVALALVETTAGDAHSVLPICISLILAVAFFELGARNYTSELLFESAVGGRLNDGGLAPLFFTTKLRHQEYFTILAPSVLVFAAIPELARRRKKIVWSSSILWMTGPACAVFVVLGAVHNPLRWTGTSSWFETMDLRMAELTTENAKATVPIELVSHLPAFLTGSIIKVDKNGKMTWISGHYANTLHVNPLLVVSGDLRLSQLFEVLNINTLDGHGRYRLLIREPNQRQPDLGVYEAIHLLAHREFTVADVVLEPKISVQFGANNNIHDANQAAVIRNGSRVLLIPLRGGSNEYEIAGARVAQAELQSLGANGKGIHIDTLLWPWSAEATLDSVVDTIRVLGTSGLPRITITTTRDAITQASIENFRALARRRHSETRLAQAAFIAVQDRNKHIEEADLELIEGALIGAETEYFQHGFLTAQNWGLTLDIAYAGPDLTLSIHSPDGRVSGSWGISIQRETGLVRRSWFVYGDTRVRMSAPPFTASNPAYKYCHYADIRSTSDPDDALIVKQIAYTQREDSSWIMITSREGSVLVSVRSDYKDGTIKSAMVRAIYGRPRRIPDCILQALMI
jgi:hypothetical protein